MAPPVQNADVPAYLDERGYSGLFYPGECACKRSDLMPCQPGEGVMGVAGCRPGYVHEAGAARGGGFIVSANAEPLSDEQWAWMMAP